MAILASFEPPPAEYPNYLTEPQPVRRRLPSAYWILLLLVTLCLMPRVVMALRIPSVCPDGVLYIHLAQAIEAGDLRSGFRDMALNTYPLILVGLHRLQSGGHHDHSVTTLQQSPGELPDTGRHAGGPGEVGNRREEDVHGIVRRTRLARRPPRKPSRWPSSRSRSKHAVSRSIAP